MRRIFAASRAATQFGDLYDSGSYHDYENLYHQMDTIMDKYGTTDDKVDVVFDRASPQDQEKLMDLAKKANRALDGNDEVTPEDMKSKYRQMALKYERDQLDAYQDGYFEAMCDMAEAFNIDLDH